MSAAFRDGLRRALIGLVHMWYFSDRGSKGDSGNWLQMLVYANDLGITHLGPDVPAPGGDRRIVVTIELENYTP